MDRIDPQKIARAILARRRLDRIQEIKKIHDRDTRFAQMATLAALTLSGLKK